MFKGIFKYIIIAQIFITALYGVSLLFFNKKLSSSEIQSVLNSKITQLDDDIRDQVHQMITIVEGLSENYEMMDSIFRGSLANFKEHAPHYLKNVHNLNKVSYLWYLSKEGKVLARAHNFTTDLLGNDLSKTEAFEMAKTLKSYGMSFAVGSAGQPAISLVTPVFSSHDNHKQLMGYIQVGTNLKDMFHDLKYETGMHMAVLYNKHNLNKDMWTRGRESTQTAWNEIEKWVLVSYSGSAKYRRDYQTIASEINEGVSKGTIYLGPNSQFGISNGFSVSLKLNDQEISAARALIFIDEINISSLAVQLSWIMILIICGVSVFTIIALYFVNQRIIFQQHQLDLAAKMSTLGELSSGIIHEIKNPLSVIQASSSFIKLMADGGTIEKEKIIKHSDKITSMVLRIVKIADIISIYSRKSNNDPFEKVQIKSIVEDSLELVKEPIMKRGIDLKSEFIETTIECRGIQLSQVTVNLLKNAADAIENDDEKWIHLKIEMSPTQDKIIISVTDSGKGLPAEVAENIFTKFYTTKGAGQGTGLGLSICKSIVESHRGKIYVDRYCENTRFVIELPLAQATAGKV